MTRPIAALNVPRRLDDIVSFARFLVAAMSDNPALSSPALPLATFAADVAELEAAQAAVLTRAKGMADARNARLAAVRADFEYLRCHVQQLADTDPAEAAVIIERAGMSVKKPPSRNKAPFEARQGRVSGSAERVAKAVAKRASYEWQYSTDQASWVIAATTLQADVVVSGLTPGVEYFFRFLPLVKTGLGDFSQVVSLLVR
jgi:hypothetical protein